MKRILLILLPLAVLTAVVMLPISAAEQGGAPRAALIERLYGDVDASGAVDTNDAVYVLRYAAKLEQFDETQLIYADANGDGNVDERDAVVILRHAAQFDELLGGRARVVFLDAEGNTYALRQIMPGQALTDIPKLDGYDWQMQDGSAPDFESVTRNMTVYAVKAATHTHTEVIDPAVKPTCTATGLSEGKHCSTCGEVLVRQEIVPALGHDHRMTGVTHPTGGAQGYTDYACSRCGDSYRGAYPPAEGFADLAQATPYLRAQMVARKSDIIVPLQGTAITSSNVSALFLAAREHTGVPNEGDYLRANMGSYSYEISHDAAKNISSIRYLITWYTDSAMEATVDAEVAKVLASLDLGDATNYEKVKGAYDWVTENVQYDYNHLDEPDYVLRHTPYAAIVDRVVTCQGYAGLYYRLMLELGVDCRMLTGDTDGERHAWNIVYLDGLYYNMDPTWDRDLMGYYRQFLCTEANFTEHIRDDIYDSSEFHASYPMAIVPYVFNVAASGKVNANISWVLDGDTGTLTVAGTGAIPSYRYNHAPWYDYRENVRSIVIGEGITEVGERALYWCTNCTSVTLPESLTAIREYGFNNLRALQSIQLPSKLRTIEFCAFSECVALKTITLPDSVTTVESNAFSNCYGLESAVLSNGMKTIPSSMFGGDTKLQSVVLPKGVTYIDDTAFINCGLKNITIPATVTGLGTSVFSGCTSLTRFNVEAGNQYFKAVDGVLFDYSGRTLLCYPSGKVVSSYTVPEGTVSIAYGAFRNATWLSDIEFPSTLNTIGGYAFSYCRRLYTVHFPANITRIGDSAFRSCFSLYRATFGNPSVTLESAVFADCDSLTGITLPSQLREIPSSLFYGSSNLRDVTIPKTVTKIGSSAFLDCDRLVSMTVPGNVRSIEQQAFDFCDRLETLTIEEGVTTLKWICIRNAPALKKVVIPASVTTIEKECFEACPNVVLYVKANSAGYRYAVNHGIDYVIMS